jgi:hypothetical protein
MAGIDASKNPAVSNVAITDANTEYPLALPEGCTRLRFQCRDGTDIRYAFETGKVAGSVSPYMTLKSGQVYDSARLFLNKNTLYLAAGSGSKVVEVEAWA